MDTGDGLAMCALAVCVVGGALTILGAHVYRSGRLRPAKADELMVLGLAAQILSGLIMAGALTLWT